MKNAAQPLGKVVLLLFSRADKSAMESAVCDVMRYGIGGYVIKPDGSTEYVDPRNFRPEEP